MEKSADFTGQYRRDMEEFLEGTPGLPEQQQRLELVRRLAGSKVLCQKVKDEKKWKKVEEVFYPILYKTASIQGGRVRLKLDEESLVGQLTYEGGCLTLDRDAFMNLDGFSSIVSDSDDIYVSGGKEGFRIQFLFRAYDLVQTAGQ